MLTTLYPNEVNLLITGKMLRDAIISAANNTSNQRTEIDALNVFPVPDGDTGTNMSMTLEAAAREASLLGDDVSVSEASNCIASALLRGARGNSGVILSLIFRGIAKSLKDVSEADGANIVNALKKGTDSAYKAVMKPTEGTILTVIRLSSVEAEKQLACDSDPVKVFAAALSGAKEALADTPNILPVLKKAGVVDAGGSGLVSVFEGMLSVFEKGEIIPSADGKAPVVKVTNNENALSTISTEDIKFAYCTEFIINRNPECALPPAKLRAYLESVGDCVVVVDDETIIKVHVHSNEPGNVITKALEYGPLVSVKIENMREQHENASWGAAQANEEANTPAPPAKPEKTYGMVAVASGDGIVEMFRELGVDEIVTGGQTMNPSTDDILNAVNKVPAEHVFVLPNNKNIIMAAEQTIRLTDKAVHVLHTKTIPQGITAAINFDESLSADENHLAMMKAAENVGTGLVTFAARDSSVEGKKISKGEILGLENGKITVVENSMVQAAYKLVKKLCKKDSSMVTVFYGEGVSEEDSEQLVSMLENKYGGDLEIDCIYGGQPVYYFIISVE